MTPRGPAGPPGKKPDGIVIVATPKSGPPPLKSPEDSPMEEGGKDGECGTCKYFDGSVRCLKFPPLGSSWAQVLPEDYCSFYESGPNHTPSPDAGASPHAEPDTDDASRQAGDQMGAQ